MFAEYMYGVLSKPRNDNFQITDLLQLSHKERESRLLCRRALRRRADWKKVHGSHQNSRLMVYTKIEGILLKRQVQDAILFYRLVKKDRIRIFNSYTENLPSRGFVCGAAR
jgi:hypothetical protein